MITSSISSLAASGLTAFRSTVEQGKLAAAGRSDGQEGVFESLVQSGLSQTHNLEQHAQTAVMDLLRGGNVEVHDAMIATQQSELAFELALQVRNKAVSAYQQMMQMQF